jgi:hypothetical protein
MFMFFAGGALGGWVILIIILRDKAREYLASRPPRRVFVTPLPMTPRPVKAQPVSETAEEGSRLLSCETQQYSDQMICRRCALTWDINDPEPPKCKEPPSE